MTTLNVNNISADPYNPEPSSDQLASAIEAESEPDEEIQIEARDADVSVAIDH